MEEEPLLLTRRVDGADRPPLDQLTLAQWLWGAGFHSPGGEEYELDLVKPFALNPAMNVLDLAAGLGGGPRAISARFGIYVTAYERDPDLAARAMEMSVQQGMQKHAAVAPYDPETMEFKASSFDCILGRLATHALVDKDRFLTAVAFGLKPRGQFMLTDFVTGSPSEPKAKAELTAWERRQQHTPHLWTVAQYTECLTGLGFDIRITEDISDRYRRLVLTGWEQLLHTADFRNMPRQHVRTIVDEAEKWMHTIAAVDSGALKVFRFYGLAPNSPPSARKGKPSAKKKAAVPAPAASS